MITVGEKKCQGVKGDRISFRLFFRSSYYSSEKSVTEFKKNLGYCHLMHMNAISLRWNTVTITKAMNLYSSCSEK